ncbi:MAG: amino acid-binding protein [Clostridia bacterium]|nr:amino acid-binding protein [Clostridia bacterium]MDD4048002.1 amino acid-binding protein [Clostridia bacterium]
MIKQISLFLENKEGRLARVCHVLGDNKINIRALSLADTTDFGVLRLIVNEPEKAYEVLKENKFAVSVTDVLAMEVSDSPGGLAGTLERLDEAEINVEYMYAFLGTTAEQALVIICVENPQEAIHVIRKAGIKVLEGDKVYSL